MLKFEAIQFSPQQLKPGDSGTLSLEVSYAGDAIFEVWENSLNFFIGEEKIEDTVVTPSPENPYMIDARTSVKLEFYVEIQSNHPLGKVSVLAYIGGIDKQSETMLTETSYPTPIWEIIPYKMSPKLHTKRILKKSAGVGRSTAVFLYKHLKKVSVVLTSLLLIFAIGLFYVKSVYETRRLEVILSEKCKGLNGNDLVYGDYVYRGDGVIVEQDGICHLKSSEGDIFTLRGKTQFHVNALGMDMFSSKMNHSFAISTGELTYQDTGLSMEPPELMIPFGKLEISSPHFWIKCDNEQILLSVYRGSTKITEAGQSETVSEGTGSIVQKGSPPSLPKHLPKAPQIFYPIQGQSFKKQGVLCRWEGNDESRYFLSVAFQNQYPCYFIGLELKGDRYYISGLKNSNYRLGIARWDTSGLLGPLSSPCSFRVNTSAPGRVILFDIISHLSSEKIQPDQVLLDGTPIEEEFLASIGAHKVTISKKGYNDETVDIDITPSHEDYSLKVELKPIPRAIAFNFTSHISPFEKINPSRILCMGKNFSENKILPGKYKFIIQRQGYLDKILEVNIAPGESPCIINEELISTWEVIIDQIKSASENYILDWESLRNSCLDYLNYGPLGGKKKDISCIAELCEFKISENKTPFPGTAEDRKTLWKAFQKWKKSECLGIPSDVSNPMDKFYSQNKRYFEGIESIVPLIPENGGLGSPPLANENTPTRFYQERARLLLLSWIKEMGSPSDMPLIEQKRFFQEQIGRMSQLNTHAPYLVTESDLKIKIQEGIRNWGSRLVDEAKKCVEEIKSFDDYSPDKIKATLLLFSDFLNMDGERERGPSLLPPQDPVTTLVLLNEKVLLNSLQRYNSYEKWKNEKENSLSERIQDIIRIRKNVIATLPEDSTYTRLMSNELDTQFNQLLEKFSSQLLSFQNTLKEYDAQFTQAKNAVATPGLNISSPQEIPQLEALINAKKKELDGLNWAYTLMDNIPRPWVSSCEKQIDILKSLKKSYENFENDVQKFKDEFHTITTDIAQYGSFSKELDGAFEYPLPKTWQDGIEALQKDQDILPKLQDAVNSLNNLQIKLEQLPISNLSEIWRPWIDWQKNFRKEKKDGLDGLVTNLSAWITFFKVYNKYTQFVAKISVLNEALQDIKRPGSLDELFKESITGEKIDGEPYLATSLKRLQKLQELKAEWTIFAEEDIERNSSPLKNWANDSKIIEWTIKLESQKKEEENWVKAYTIYKKYYKLLSEIHSLEQEYQTMKLILEKFKTMAQIHILLETSLNVKARIAELNNKFNKIEFEIEKEKDPWWSAFHVSLANLKTRGETISKKIGEIKLPEIQYTFDPKGKDAKHKAGKMTETGWIVTTEEKECHILYGPYTKSIPAGSHISCFFLKIDQSLAPDTVVCEIDVWIEDSKKSLSSKKVLAGELSPGKFQAIELAFTNSPEDNIEFRIYHYGLCNLEIEKVEVWPNN